MQSPINIASQNVMVTRQLPPFNFFYYQVTENVFIKVVKSPKRTAQMAFIGSKVIFLKGGGLPDIYKLDEFHFHWGLELHKSSEHTIDGKHFPLELHIVHHQSKLYNFKTASTQPFGLAVVVFMFKLVPDENLGFKKFLGKFDANLGYLDNFALSEIIPVYDNLEYYRYYGSMTSPPCTESVIWSVMKKPIPISGEQLKALKHVLNPMGNPLLHNHRPLQNRNRRPIFSAIFKSSNDALCQKAKYWLALYMVVRLC
ncbi:unnamed protein product [Lymnaea stagnalis]|uniref:Carbonic anhydrase n=1 Tax=Lymnaea stagnalis TaxID=6523 RepID=A0AAV2IDA2_LYMST